MLRGWVQRESGPVRVGFLIDNEPAGYWGLGAWGGEVSGREASQVLGFNIPFSGSFLGKIGPGRVSIQVETERRKQVIWRWEGGVLGEEEPEAVLGLRNWVERTCDFFSSVDVPQRLSPELHLLFVYSGDLEALAKSWDSLGERRTFVDEVLVLASGTEAIDESEFQDKFSGKLTLVRGLSDILGSSSECDSFLVCRPGVDLSLLRLDRLYGVTREGIEGASGIKMIEPLFLSHQGGARGPGGHSLSGIFEAFSNFRPEINLFERDGFKTAPVFIATRKFLEQCFEQDIYLREKIHKSLVCTSEIVAPLSDLGGLPESDFAYTEEAQNFFTLELRSLLSSHKPLKKGEQAAILVLSEDIFYSLNTSQSQKLLERARTILRNLAESETKTFLVLDGERGGHVEGRRLIFGQHSLGLQECEDFFASSKSPWTIALEGRNLFSAQALASLLKGQVAGLVGDKTSEDLEVAFFSEQSGEAGAFLPIKYSYGEKPSKALYAYDSLVDLTATSLPLLPSLDKAALDIHSSWEEKRREQPPLVILSPLLGPLSLIKQGLDSLLAEMSDSQLILLDPQIDRFVSAWAKDFKAARTDIEILEINLGSSWLSQAYKWLLESKIGEAKTGSDKRRSEASPTPSFDLFLHAPATKLPAGGLKAMRDASYSSWGVGMSTCLSSRSFELNTGDSLSDLQKFLEDKSFSATSTLSLTAGAIYIRSTLLERIGRPDESFSSVSLQIEELMARSFCNGFKNICVKTHVLSEPIKTWGDNEVETDRFQEERKLLDNRWGRYLALASKQEGREPPIEDVKNAYSAISKKKTSGLGEADLQGSLAGLSRTRPGGHLRLLNKTRVVFLVNDLDASDTLDYLASLVGNLERQGFLARILSLGTGPMAQSSKFHFAAPLVLSKEEFFALDWSRQHVVATSPATAFYLAELLKRQETLVAYYYLDDYLPWHFARVSQPDVVQEIEKSYGLGLKLVTSSATLSKKIQEAHRIKSSVIQPGIDSLIFTDGYQSDFIGPVRTLIGEGLKEETALMKVLTKASPETVLSGIEGLELGSPDAKIGFSDCSFQKEADLGAKFRANDIFVDLAVFGGSKLDSLRAMASGAVPIFTRGGLIQDYLRDGENCLSVEQGSDSDLAEALRKLVKDRSFRLELREKAIASAKGFSLEASTNSWAKLFQENSVAKTY